MKLKWETELEFLKRKVDEYEKKIGRLPGYICTAVQQFAAGRECMKLFL